MNKRPFFPCFGLALAALALILAAPAEARDMEALRQAMVDTQIQARGIEDPQVLAAMETVPRHLFVPEDIQGLAYQDRPLPIGEGQTISQPYIVALMTSVLNLAKGDKVLEVGTGSGYQAAVAARIAKVVYSIEIVEALGETAKKTLADLGYDNVHVKIGDGYQGWPEHAPFHKIIVTCAPTKIPQPLVDQLAEGGRMVIPVGERYAQELVLLEKQGGEIVQKDIVPVRFVPMVSEDGKRY